MRPSDFFRLLYHNIRTQKARFILLLISMIILIVPIISAFSVCDMSVDYKQSLVESEYGERGTGIRILGADARNNPALYEFVKDELERNNLPYKLTDTEYEYQVMNEYEVTLTAFDTLDKNLLEGTCNESKFATDIWVSSALYRLLQQLGINVGDTYAFQLKRIYSSETIDLTKTIGGVYQSDKLEFYLHYSALNTDVGSFPDLNYAIKGENKPYKELIALYNKLEKTLEGAITVVTDIPHHSSGNVLINIVEDSLPITFHAAMCYLVAGIITVILAGVIINNLLTTLSISLKVNEKTYYIFGAMGMKNRHLFAIMLCESLAMIISGFLLSLACTAIIGQLLVTLTNNLLGSAVAKFSFSTGSIFIVFAALLIVTCLFVLIKLLSKKGKSAISLLRGTK